MSAAVGAALKKVLVAILTEPKVLKNVLFAILVVVVAMKESAQIKFLSLNQLHILRSVTTLSISLKVKWQIF